MALQVDRWFMALNVESHGFIAAYFEVRFLCVCVCVRLRQEERARLFTLFSISPQRRLSFSVFVCLCAGEQVCGCLFTCEASRVTLFNTAEPTRWQEAVKSAVFSGGRSLRAR